MVSYSEVTHRRVQDARRVLILIVMDNGLLPLCRNGQRPHIEVLILIVMDNGLLLAESDYNKGHGEVVLILIVMDNGLLRIMVSPKGEITTCLNPYCNG